mgnify:FL=1
MNGFMQSIKKRLIALGVVLVLLAAVGGYWYVDIYTKTPEYTLKMVQEAVSDHNKEKLDKYVAVDHLLDTASDDMLDGLIQAMVPATGDTREAVSNLSRMFKTPVVTSLRTAVMNYVEYGSWTNQKSDDNSVNGLVDADMIVNRIGLPSIEFQKLDSMAVDKEEGTALAKVRVLQTDSNEEFVLDVELCQQEDGLWQVYEIVNFKDFIEKLQNIRQQQVKAYLEESSQLMAQHDAVIAESQQRITAILAGGTLGNDGIRSQVKKVSEEQVADWQSRKAELEAMEVPDAAGSLHRLRLKICDARIEAAANYAKWMDDKKAATIRASDNSMKIAKTLEKDAELLTKQVNAHVK